MLVDGCTKPLTDVPWARYYSTGCWVPTEAIICERGSDGKKSTLKIGPSLLTLWTEGESFEGKYEEDDFLLLIAQNMKPEAYAVMVYFLNFHPSVA